MTAVWNLMRMDLRKMMSLRGIMLLYFAIFIICEAAGSMGNFFASSFGFIIFIYLWVYGPSGYGGDQLYGILPVTRQQMVMGRYGFSMAGILAATVCAGAVQFVMGAAGRLHFLMIFCMGCAFAALALPPLLYFGPVKARYYVLAIYGLGLAGGGAWSAIANASEMEAVLQPGIGMVLAALALLAVSYLVTLRLLKRKEFDG